MHFPFTPNANATAQINSGAASQSVQLYPECHRPVTVQIVNDGTATVWVAFGDSTVVASLTTSFPVSAGAAINFTAYNNNNGPLYVAAIAVGATGKVYFTPGTGGY